MIRATSIISVCLILLSACAEEVLPLRAPGLDGPLTTGTWEQLGRTGISFWPPSPEGTQLPEIIHFGCEEGTRGQLRITVTGNTDDTALWIAGDRQRSRKVLFETEQEVVELDFIAGGQKLPHVIVKTDAAWITPLMKGEGRIAINAYGGRIYRLSVPDALGRTIKRCGKPT